MFLIFMCYVLSSKGYYRFIDKAKIYLSHTTLQYIIAKYLLKKKEATRLSFLFQLKFEQVNQQKLSNRSRRHPLRTQQLSLQITDK